MSVLSNTNHRLLVLITPTDSGAETVEYALREARDLHVEADSSVRLDIRLIDTPDGPSITATRRRRIDSVIDTFEHRGDIETTLDVQSVTTTDPTEQTATIVTALRSVTPSRVIVDPESSVSVAALREAFGITSVEIASVEHEQPRRRLVHAGGVRRLLSIFALTYLFYLAIGGFALGLDLVTGAISAGIVAISLAHVTFREEPTVTRTGGRLVRMLLFVPILLWEIVKANFSIAYVILHPRLPIDPTIETIETATTEPLERMVLANSITLTPGTVTVDVRGAEFTIHSLTTATRDGLAGSRLERLVAWVFHGHRNGQATAPEEEEEETP